MQQIFNPIDIRNTTRLHSSRLTMVVWESPVPNETIDLTTILVLDLQGETHMKGFDNP
jgi:hypothetical protein